jgi:hypothetical protein
MKLNRYSGRALLALMALAVGGNALALGPDPTKVKIAGISYAGSGCPAGSVSEMLSPDREAFTLLFDSYIAEAGPGISLANGRKNCQVAVDLRFPQGWSYTIFDVDYRGFAQLDPGTVGTQKTTYYFQGSSQSVSLQSNYTGPKNADYHIRDSLGLDAVVWSPCGATRAVNMNTQVRVTASGSRRALMTIDSIDGQLKHRYGIRWRRCS